MRVLIIGNLYPPRVLGGYEILCEQVVEELRERKHQVTVLTSEPAPGDAAGPGYVHRALKLEVPFGAPFRASRLRRLAIGRRNRRLTAEYLESIRPDVIFLWSQRRLTLGPARAAEASGVPVFWTLNDEFLAGFRAVRPNGTLRRWIGAMSDRTWSRRETLAAVGLERLTAISHCLKDSLVEAGVAAAAEAEVIYQGPPLDRFPSRGPIRRVRKCLYVGQLHPDKGTHTAISAVHRVAEDHPQISLTILGRGNPDYTDRLKELATQGPARVRFLGGRPHEEVPEVYREHDLLLFPSIWREPFGLTHLEAMSSGLPVISTANGGQGEVLEDGKTALLVPPSDDHLLAEALRRLVESPALARRLAERGHRLVQEDLNLEKYVDRLESWLLRGIGPSAEALP